MAAVFLFSQAADEGWQPCLYRVLRTEGSWMCPSIPPAAVAVCARSGLAPSCRMSGSALPGVESRTHRI